MQRLKRCHGVFEFCKSGEGFRRSTKVLWNCEFDAFKWRSGAELYPFRRALPPPSFANGHLLSDFFSDGMGWSLVFLVSFGCLKSAGNS